MKIAWTESAWNDYLYWQSLDKKTLKRINKLIKDTQRSPLEGLGNPEMLKHDLQGFYSRRIDGQNRFVYSLKDDTIIIIACRYNY